MPAIDPCTLVMEQAPRRGQSSGQQQRDEDDAERGATVSQARTHVGPTKPEIGAGRAPTCARDHDQNNRQHCDE
jgi:hypothetical protein